MQRRQIGLAFVLLLGSSPWSVAHADHYDSREIERRIGTAEARTCLADARRLGNESASTPREIVKLYDAEICIGRYLVGFAGMPDSDLPVTLDNLERWQPDEDRGATVHEAVAYLRGNRDRFREIFDGWKGEANLFEPNESLLSLLRDRFPESAERWEIEWDLAFKDLTRQFTFSRGARDKTCKQVYDGIVAGAPEEYHKSYSDADVAERISDCERQRTRFASELAELEARFVSKPLEKKRTCFAIDPSDVISNLYFGLC